MMDSLPEGPGFQVQWLNVTGDLLDKNKKPIEEQVEFWHRDPIDCVKEILGNPALQPHIKYAPERIYQDLDRKIRVYEGMHTADWWWETQVRWAASMGTIQVLKPIKSEIEIGTTIAPIILSTDKTHLSNFSGDKAAWPIYSK
jgi:hypothetical protein